MFRPKSIALFTVSLLILSLVAFYSKLPLVFFRFDGSQVLILAAIQRDWSIGGWDFTSNPLQGIGGFEILQHNLIDPGTWLLAYLPPKIAPVLSMSFYALELAIAIGWLSVRLGLRPVGSAVAVWIGLLLALPYVYPSLGFDFLWGVPYYISLIFTNTVIIVLYIDLGRGPRRADIARLAGIIFVGAYQLNMFTFFAPLSFLALAVFGVAAVLMAESKRERTTKLLYFAAPAGVLLLVFVPLLYGMYGFSKATFFWYEFYLRSSSWRDLTFFVADHSRWPAWVALGLALAGALHAALRGGATMRAMARGFLVFIGCELIVSLIMTIGWKGPRLAYIDIFAYPFYCVFAAHALAIAVGWLNQHTDAIHRHYRVAIVVLGVLPWLVLLDIRPPPLKRPLVRNLNPYVWPPAETPVTKYLSAEIALRPGSTFRGRVASVAGTDFEPEWALAPMITQHNFDVMNLFFSGNDHRLYGLWYFGIPTLHELSQFSSPFFHLVNARLLNVRGAKDLRSYEIQSVVNDRVMALLGARYLISDKVLPGRTAVVHHRLVEGRDLYVYPVSGTNVSGYAVTHARRAADAREAIDLLADPSIDLRTVAILTGPEELPPLTVVTASNLIMDRGAYRVEATSAGTSLLVLPVEYSRCLEAHLTTSSQIPPQLLRANLAMTAVLFTSDVKGDLRLRYGPLSSGCRMHDWRDADALKIGDVRDWPAAH
jgi:hypothetical protein